MSSRLPVAPKPSTYVKSSIRCPQAQYRCQVVYPLDFSASDNSGVKREGEGGRERRAGERGGRLEREIGRGERQGGREGGREREGRREREGGREREGRRRERGRESEGVGGRGRAGGREDRSFI